MKHEAWTDAEALGVPLSKGQIEALEAFETLLRRHALALGAVGPSDEWRLRERHVLDSLRGAPCLPEGARTGVDIGSGAGLPGIPIAIARPDVRLMLAEKRRNRAAFLELAVDELGLANVEIHLGDAGQVPGAFDVCLARAFGSAREAWQAAGPLLVPSGALLYWAGRSFDTDRDVPEGTLVTLFRSPTLANAGPIAIMTHQ